MLAHVTCCNTLHNDVHHGLVVSSHCLARSSSFQVRATVLQDLPSIVRVGPCKFPLSCKIISLPLSESTLASSHCLARSSPFHRPNRPLQVSTVLQDDCLPSIVRVGPRRMHLLMLQHTTQCILQPDSAQASCNTSTE